MSHYRPIQRQLGIATAFSLLASVGACGNLSNDDLLFLAGIPRAEELALEVEGTGSGQPNALSTADAVGEPAVYYEVAHELATGLNAGVAEILTMVDTLGRGHPPTTRTESSRIWGPVQNVDGEGKTIRLEISRSPRADGGPRYDFCLQFGRDGDFQGGKGSCSPGKTAGLANILWGYYEPATATGGARSGVGEIHLDFEAFRRIGAGKEEERGLLAISYDFTGGGETKALALDWLLDLGGGSVPQTIGYEYNRNLMDEVDFHFEYTEDVVGGGWQDPVSEKLETATIDACWTEGGSGRADAMVRGGDVRAGESVTAAECWDRNQNRTFMQLVVTQDPASNQTEGDPGACPDC